MGHPPRFSLHTEGAQRDANLWPTHENCQVQRPQKQSLEGQVAAKLGATLLRLARNQSGPDGHRFGT